MLVKILWNKEKHGCAGKFRHFRRKNGIPEMSFFVLPLFLTTDPVVLLGEPQRAKTCTCWIFLERDGHVLFAFFEWCLLVNLFLNVFENCT